MTDFFFFVTFVGGWGLQRTLFENLPNIFGLFQNEKLRVCRTLKAQLFLVPTFIQQHKAELQPKELHHLQHSGILNKTHIELHHLQHSDILNKTHSVFVNIFLFNAASSKKIDLV